MDSYEEHCRRLFPLYKRAAEEGSPVSQYRLGDMYYYGISVTKNYHEAAKWYQKAAMQEMEYAQRSLGMMYAKGEGVPQDYHEAFKWYKKSVHLFLSSGQILGGHYVRSLTRYAQGIIDGIYDDFSIPTKAGWESMKSLLTESISQLKSGPNTLRDSKYTVAEHELTAVMLGHLGVMRNAIGRLPTEVESATQRVFRFSDLIPRFGEPPDEDEFMMDLKFAISWFFSISERPAKVVLSNAPSKEDMEKLWEKLRSYGIDLDFLSK